VVYLDSSKSSPINERLSDDLEADVDAAMCCNAPKNAIKNCLVEKKLINKITLTVCIHVVVLHEMLSKLRGQCQVRQFTYGA
jgi:hypothetical protein